MQSRMRLKHVKDDLERFACLALAGIDREYPFHVTHVFGGDGGVASPRDIWPVFYGCFDWHSAVHGHWLLARAKQLDVLERRLTPEALECEAAYVRAHSTFERPYGLAWVLALAQELPPSPMRDAIKPLETAAVDNLTAWLPKLSFPNRTGTHNQTAFAMVLALDYAEHVSNESLAALVRERALSFHADDRDYPLHLEPSGEDFLSPSLSAAWLMERVLEPPAFGAWLERVMPTLGRGFSFEPVEPTDRSDGRLAHLDGLNLSRAWMLNGIAASLDPERKKALCAMAASHLEMGLVGVKSEHYAGSHWLGTFAARALAR
jgi:hypothetical protein